MALDRLSNFDQKWQSKKNKGFRSANNQCVENFWPRFPLYFQNSPRMRLSGFWIIGKLPVSVPNVRKSNWPKKAKWKYFWLNLDIFQWSNWPIWINYHGKDQEWQLHRSSWKVDPEDLRESLPKLIRIRNSIMRIIKLTKNNWRRNCVLIPRKTLFRQQDNHKLIQVQWIQGWIQKLSFCSSSWSLTLTLINKWPQ